MLRKKHEIFAYYLLFGKRKSHKVLKFHVNDFFYFEIIAGFEIAIRELRSLLTLPFRRSLEVIFCEINKLKLSFCWNFVFRETKTFLTTLQARQFIYILLQKMLKYTLFSWLWIAFWSKCLGLHPQWGSLQHFPVLPTCWN